MEYTCKRCNKIEKNIKKEVYELRKELCGDCYYIKSELQDIIDRLYFIGSKDEIDDVNFSFIASAKRQLEKLLEKMYVRCSMKSKVFTKRVFSLELTEEELGIVAGALYCANNEDIKCFVDKYKYPCSGYSFDEVAELQEKLSEEVNKLIEGKKE